MAFTNIADLNTARDGNRNAGNSSAGITIAGSDISNFLATTEEWDGNNWNYGGNLNTARWDSSAQGLQTASLVEAGEDATYSALSNSEEYNGTSWSYGGNLNTAREDGAGSGNLNAALINGGDDLAEESILSSSEEYDGTSWSYGGNLNTSREGHGGAGDLNTTLIASGYDDLGYILISSEEYDGASWSYGGNLNTARELPGGFGDNSNSLILGGYYSSYLNTSEKYDGTSFSYGDNLNIARYNFGAFGNLNNGLCAGGSNGNYLSSAEIYSEITFTSTFGIIQYNKLKSVFETPYSFYCLLPNFYSGKTQSKFKINYNISQNQSIYKDAIIDYHSIFQTTQNQSIYSYFKFKLSQFTTQNQSLLAFILPHYNLLSRDIIYFRIIKSLDQPIDTAEFKLQGNIDIDLFDWIKIQKRNIINNSLETIFLGFVTDFMRDLNQEIIINTIKAKSPEYLLANQYINESYVNTSKNINPSKYVKIMLGNEENWDKETAIYPYNISDIPNYSQDYQFKWSPIFTTKLQAIQEIEKRYSMKYLTDYANISNIPRVRAYFVHNDSISALLDHKTFDMNNDSTIFTIYKTQNLDNYKNTIKVWGYNTSLEKIKSEVIYSNKSYPLEYTHESFYLQNQSQVNEYANILYNSFVYMKERYEAIGRLRTDLRPGQTLNISNLSEHSNETFTIYYVEHNFSKGLEQTRFKYAKIQNQAFIESNKDLTIIDIIKNIAQKEIEKEKIDLLPHLATIININNQIANIRIENSSMIIENVHILDKNKSENDKVLYLRYTNCAW